MKMIIKSTLATLAMASVAVLVPGAASAGASVSVGVAIPTPVVVVAPDMEYSPYDTEYYYDPIFISGSWYHGPHRWKMRDGHRVYMVNGSWRRNEWRDNTFPATITFHNGGHYRAGQYHGFDSAARINARMRNRADRREDRQEDRQQDRREDQQNDCHDGDDDKSTN